MLIKLLDQVLWGAVNPSGRLPYTIAQSQSAYSFADITNSTALLETENPNAWQSNFEERLLIDYRKLSNPTSFFHLPDFDVGWFDYYNEPVQYEFGFGLSYTNFSMGNVTVKRLSKSTIPSHPPKQAIQPGGNPALWENLYSITAEITNTGAVAGTAVPQLYLGLPQIAHQDFTPKKVLRGFEKVVLEPGKKSMVTFNLTRRDISYWDIVAQQWLIPSGSIKAMAGFSSRNIQNTTSFSPLSSPGSY